MVLHALIQKDYLLYVGPVDNRALVSHQALGLVIARPGGFTITTPDQGMITCRGALINSHTLHQLCSQGHSIIVIMFEPQSDLARYFKTTHELQYGQINRLNSGEVDAYLNLLSSAGQVLTLANCGRAAEFLRLLVGTNVPPLDARISWVITYIDRNIDASFRLDSLSEMVHLSKDRFAHLFAKQVGIPLTKYILWAKIKRQSDPYRQEPH